MALNINSAFRIHSLITALPSANDSTQVLEVWSQLFDITEPNPIKKATAVTERLMWVNKELEIAHLQLKKSTFSTSLYEVPISQLENAFSPMLLNAQWHSVRQYFAPDTLKALAFCIEVLPDEEANITSEHLGELYARIEELEVFLENSNLPVRLQTLIRRHLSLIRQALAEYPIAGAKALLEARRAAYGEFFEVTEVFTEDSSAEVSKLKEVWSTLNKIIDGAIKIDGLAQIAEKNWPLLRNLLEKLNN